MQIDVKGVELLFRKGINAAEGNFDAWLKVDWAVVFAVQGHFRCQVHLQGYDTCEVFWWLQAGQLEACPTTKGVSNYPFPHSRHFLNDDTCCRGYQFSFWPQEG